MRRITAVTTRPPSVCIHSIGVNPWSMFDVDAALLILGPWHQFQMDTFTLLQKRPLVAAILTTLLYMCVSAGLGLLTPLLFPQVQPEFVVVIALAVLLALALSLLGWWRAVGFNAPAEWHAVPWWGVPVVIVFVIPFLDGLKPSDLGTFLYLAVAYALTGFMEEGLMRGIVLRLLRPLGVTRSVIISSLLFGLIHAGNVLYRNPAIVAAQMLGAFVHGIGLGAIRLKSNTIWFVIILHTFHDLFLRYSNFPLIALDVVQVTLLMVYGLLLLKYAQEPGQGSVVSRQ